MPKNWKEGSSAQPNYALPNTPLPKIPSTSKRRPPLPANTAGDDLIQQLSSCRISAESSGLPAESSQTVKSSNKNKRRSQQKSFSEASQQCSECPQTVTQCLPNTQPRRVHHLKNANNCTTSGRSKKKKSKNASNKNQKPLSPLDCSKKLDSPFVRGLEEFITVDSPSSKHSVNLGRARAHSEGHITKIGRQRDTPKRKTPSRLKRCILSERAVRKAKRSQSLPATKSTNKLDSPKLSNSDVYKTPIKSCKSLLQMQCNLILELITQLAVFQDRAYVVNADSPFHRKRGRRFVCGFREVIKHLKLKHMRIIIIASDLEGKAIDFIYKNKVGTTEQEDKSNVGLSALEELLCEIQKLAEEYKPPVPIFVAHTRRALAHMCHKPTAVSIVGIINTNGAYEIEKKLLEMGSVVNFGLSGGSVQTGDNNCSLDDSIATNTDESFLL
uniref:Ribosomal protein eL8/eL30/eS12/Gadd45 domain-containing protein n=1 Tax=Trichobilharzia regenti TaxID=157069 RepID=A0AA85JX72_TRIRE|nr:unnamed protein product [Trichobilharzia regenti]